MLEEKSTKQLLNVATEILQSDSPQYALEKVQQNSREEKPISLANRSRRNRLELIYCIVQFLSQGPLDINQIALQSRLNFKISKEILRCLKDDEIVETLMNNGRIVYSLTEKGFELRHSLQTTQELLLKSKTKGQIVT
jgi:predicted transcriptional regulator